jgi:hypothetical protein
MMRIERVVEIEHPGLDPIEAARAALSGFRHCVFHELGRAAICRP